MQSFSESYRYLIKFLAKLTEYQDANKMTPGNMAIVLGPNLLWTHTEPYVLTTQLHLHGWIFTNTYNQFSVANWFPLLYSNMTEMMTTVSLQIVGIIEPIIQHADWFFPGGGDPVLMLCTGLVIL